jgi:signal transduction histidine kinase
MPLRSKLIIFAVVMFFLFTGLSVGSFLSLSSASREAESAREELAKLALVEALEESCAGLERDSDFAGCARACNALEKLREKQWLPMARVHLDHLLSLSQSLLHGEPEANAGDLKTAVAELKASIIEQVNEDLRSAHEPAHRRAWRLLVAASFLTLGGAGTFAWLYSRLVRERRALEDRLHRSERLAALGTLAAGIAHEINNPLATISVSAESLAERLPPATDPDGYLAVIEEEAGRCRNIIGELSDLARGGSLDRGPVDAEGLVADAVRIVERNRALPRAVITVDVAPNLPLLSADRGKMIQVLVNLLRNAIEASGPRGRVAAAVRISGERLLLTVADNGKGIPREHMERIFDPFYTDKESGVGLGLSLCHRIAELHGGDLTADSPGSGRGSTFTLSIPMESVDGE